MGYRELYDKWRVELADDTRIQAELAEIAGDDEEIKRRFGAEMSFGTGGLRGVIGAGINRMNKYVVRRVTQGLADYLADAGPEAKKAGVAIAYDSRHKSLEFATEAARVLAGNGVQVYLFTGIRPTPELSFAIRHLKAAGGIVITASHNPPQYNGYKVYGADGGQLLPPEAKDVSDRAERIREFNAVKLADFAEAKRTGLIREIDAEVDDPYIASLVALMRETAGEPGAAAGDISILYTPLHGTGYKLVPHALQSLGFKKFEALAEQSIPDPNFSTVCTPNPEDHTAFKSAFARAADFPADLILATDPDCDRVGVAVRTNEGYRNLSGNELGVLLTDYLLERAETRGQDLGRSVIIKTIVTTEMTRAIAAAYGVTVIDTLTGFKYIGAKMNQLKEEGRHFLLGYEESCGYLTGDMVRDKDAVLACALTALMGAYHRAQGKTLIDRLGELRRTYGHYATKLISIPLPPGTSGDSLLASLRKAQPGMIAGTAVTEVRDYLTGKATEIGRGKTRQLDFPEENAMQYVLADEGLITLRPSGTEPKVKLYLEVKAKDGAEAGRRLAELEQAVMGILGRERPAAGA